MPSIGILQSPSGCFVTCPNVCQYPSVSISVRVTCYFVCSAKIPFHSLTSHFIHASSIFFSYYLWPYISYTNVDYTLNIRFNKCRIDNITHIFRMQKFFFFFCIIWPQQQPLVSNATEYRYQNSTSIGVRYRGIVYHIVYTYINVLSRRLFSSGGLTTTRYCIVLLWFLSGTTSDSGWQCIFQQTLFYTDNRKT